MYVKTLMLILWHFLLLCLFQLFISLCIRHNKVVCKNPGVVEHLFGLSSYISRLLTVWDMYVYIRKFSDQVDAGWDKHDRGHLGFHGKDLYRKKTSDILKYEIVNVYHTRSASLNFEQLWRLLYTRNIPNIMI